MSEFPRTNVGGISVPRLVIGTNWFLGYSHQSAARDRFIHRFQSSKTIADVLEVFFNAGCEAILGPMSELLIEAVHDAQGRTGKKAILLLTPCFNIGPQQESNMEPVLDQCKKMGATFAMPHQSVTDALLDKITGEIRNWPNIAKAVRDRGMIPGFSTHEPDTVCASDRADLDVETYLQIYNCVGFMMHCEIDWVMRIIRNAKHPVIAFKTLAAGRLIPPVGLAFVWNTIREQDMVCIGTTTPDEAKEVIELSLDFISRRLPEHELQKTRSKKSLE